MNISIIYSIVIISLAFFGESIFGLGGGFISIPLLSIILGVKNAVTLVLIFQLFMGVLILKTYKYTQWKIVLPMTISIVIGTVVGTYMLSLVSDNLLRKILAATIFLFLIKMIFFQGFNLGEKGKFTWGSIIGFIGGWFQGLNGTSSPIFTMYLSAFQLTKSHIRAALIYIFFVTSIVRVIISYSRGLFTSHIIYFALPTIPFFLAAIFLGNLIHTKVSEIYYRYVIYAILFVSAVSMLIK